MLPYVKRLMAQAQDVYKRQVNALGDSNPDIVKRLPTYHAIILAKNNTGRVNLYKLISESHLTYYAKRPRIPKSLLLAHREGLIPVSYTHLDVYKRQSVSGEFRAIQFELKAEE